VPFLLFFFFFLSLSFSFSSYPSLNTLVLLQDQGTFPEYTRLIFHQHKPHVNMQFTKSTIIAFAALLASADASYHARRFDNGTVYTTEVSKP